jgi:hypothetical protein
LEIQEEVSGLVTRTSPFGGGVNGVGTLSLPEVPGVPRGPSPVYHCLLVVSSSPSCSSCHPLPLGTIASSYLRFPEVSQDSTAPMCLLTRFYLISSPKDFMHHITKNLHVMGLRADAS